MRRVFVGGFIVSSLQIIWKYTALIIRLFDPTNGSNIKTTFIQLKSSDWNELLIYNFINLNLSVESYLLKMWVVRFKSCRCPIGALHFWCNSLVSGQKKPNKKMKIMIFISFQKLSQPL